MRECKWLIRGVTRNDIRLEEGARGHEQLLRDDMS